MSAERRIAWITGAGKGIGRALALHLAAAGWTVAASARTPADLEALAAAAGRIVPMPLDVTDREGVGAALAAIERRVGPVDLCVLNAGTHRADRVADFSAAATGALMETNFMGTVNCLEVAMAAMVARRRGRIAVVASLAGYCGLPHAAGYGASKAALINLCESLRPELRRTGVTLQLINPGFVKTPLTDRNEFPMPFMISAEEAAAAIAKGLDGGRFEIAFPRRLAWLMRGLRRLPHGLYFAVTGRMVRP